MVGKGHAEEREEAVPANSNACDRQLPSSATEQTREEEEEEETSSDADGRTNGRRAQRSR